MLRQVAREVEQLLGQGRPLLRQRRFRIEAAFGQASQQIGAAVEPVVHLGHLLDDGQVDAERAPAVAQRALGAVADHHRRQRRALAPILAVDVLDDFLAALVLEVDVDVGRLVALLRDEALEQQAGARRIDLGDAQAVADRRVGGRTAALAQDVLRPGEAHDVVHRQEVVLVLHVGDQAQLVLDLGLHLGGNAFAEAPVRADIGFRAQVAAGRVAGRDHFVRVFVAQLVEREGAQARDAQRLGQGLARVDVGQAQARAQVLLGVLRQAVAAFGHRLAQARGGERVLQGLA